MKNLFEKYPQLEALNNRDLFISGKLIGNYGIIWNDELDIDAETIYEDGILVRTEEISINAKVGDALAKCRSDEGITQVELAKRSGIDQADISRIERGISNPSLNTLERLATAMNKSLNIDFR